MFKTAKLLIAIIVCLVFFTMLAGQALAFTKNYNNFLNQAANTGTYKITEQSQPAFINTFAGKMITMALGFIGVLFLLLILYSGFQWMSAGGNEEAVTKAKTRVINGTIGLVITLGAFIITNTLFSYLNEKFLAPQQTNVTPPPAENTCNQFQERNTCINGNCFWEFTGPRTGICFATSGCDPSCPLNYKYCLEDNNSPTGYACKECQDNGDCGDKQCVNGSCSH
ncbi:MAG: pilin [Candidatus Komeilibacteria bacterium]|nr:pilin [Candidatus Komeilibacteria bacterium]